MRISSEMLITQAEATGFRTDILEKVGLLIHLLEALRSRSQDVGINHHSLQLTAKLKTT